MPTPPPRNAAGVVTPHDHDEIGAGDGVIRRISEQQLVMDKHGQRRISSIAYQASDGPDGGLSIDIENFIVAGGIDAKQWVTTPRWIGSVRFTAGFLRGHSLQVGYDPIEEANDVSANPYHGEVWGEFTRSKKKALQEAAIWFVEIEGAALR